MNFVQSPYCIDNNYANDMLLRYEHMFRKGLLTDVRIISDTDNREFLAHRLVLAAASEFFADLFRSNTPTTPSGLINVHLRNCDSRSVELVLNFIYSGALPSDACDSVKVLNIAKTCKITALEKLLARNHPAIFLSARTSFENNDCHVNTAVTLIDTFTKDVDHYVSIANGCGDKSGNNNANTGEKEPLWVQQNIAAQQRSLSSNQHSNFVLNRNDDISSMNRICNRCNVDPCSCLYQQNIKSTFSTTYVQQPNITYNNSQATIKTVPKKRKFDKLLQDMINGSVTSSGLVTKTFGSNVVDDLQQHHLNNSRGIVSGGASDNINSLIYEVEARINAQSDSRSRRGDLIVRSAMLPLEQSLNRSQLPVPTSVIHRTLKDNIDTTSSLAKVVRDHQQSSSTSSIAATFASVLDSQEVAILNRATNSTLGAMYLPSENTSSLARDVKDLVVDGSMSITNNSTQEYTSSCRNRKYITKAENGMFECTICGKTYSRYNSTSYHVTIYHRNAPIKCDIPGCTFSTREARYIHFHKFYRHKVPLPDNIDLDNRQCPFCRHIAKSPAMLEKHINRHMPDCIRIGRIMKCTICEKELSTKASLRQHLLTHTEEKSFQCPHCCYKGRTASNLRQHCMFKHNNVGKCGSEAVAAAVPKPVSVWSTCYKCDTCAFTSPSELVMLAHQRRTHKRDIPSIIEKIQEEEAELKDANNNVDVEDEDFEAAMSSCDATELVGTTGSDCNSGPKCYNTGASLCSSTSSTFEAYVGSSSDKVPADSTTAVVKDE